MALQVIPPTEASALVDATPSPLDRVVKVGGSVLGRGLVRPFRRNDRSDFANEEGLANVRACVGQILGMRGASETTQGELEWDPERGSLLHLLKHQRAPAVVQELGRRFVIDTLRRWEPRVIVKTVAISQEVINDGETVITVVVIRLTYDVIRTNVPGNDVIFGNVEQTVTLPTGGG